MQMISIHTLCEEGDDLYDWFSVIPNRISIHTLCEEGDEGKHFYCLTGEISIHTLCEEGDKMFDKF